MTAEEQEALLISSKLRRVECIPEQEADEKEKTRPKKRKYELLSKGVKERVTGEKERKVVMIDAAKIPLPH